MRRGIGLATVCAAVAVSSPASAGVREPVYWNGYDTPPRIEPKRVDVVLGGNLFRARELFFWVDWGSTKTFATGEIKVNTCRPTCADENYATRTGAIRLREKRRCGSRLQYRHIVIEYRNRRWPDLHADVTCKGYEDP